MPDYTPVYQPGTAWSATTSAAVTGGQILAVTGNGTVGPAAANSTAVVGVAAFDTASGGRVTVHALGGVVHELNADTGGVTAGALLRVGSTSASVVALGAGTFDQFIGVALSTASAGAKVRVLGTR